MLYVCLRSQCIVPCGECLHVKTNKCLEEVVQRTESRLITVWTERLATVVTCIADSSYVLTSPRRR